MNWPNPTTSANCRTRSGSPLYSSSKLATPPCPRVVATFLCSKQHQIKGNASVHVQYKFKREYVQVSKAFYSRFKVSKSIQSFKGILPVEFNYQRHSTSQVQLSRHSTCRFQLFKGILLVDFNYSRAFYSRFKVSKAFYQLIQLLGHPTVESRSNPKLSHPTVDPRHKFKVESRHIKSKVLSIKSSSSSSYWMVQVHLIQVQVYSDTTIQMEAEASFKGIPPSSSLTGAPWGPSTRARGRSHLAKVGNYQTPTGQRRVAPAVCTSLQQSWHAPPMP